MKQPVHIPVLLKPTLDTLQPQTGESYLDLTAGYAGHAQAILKITQSPDLAVLVDRDQVAIDYIGSLSLGVKLVHQDYLLAAKTLVEEGRQFDMILLDLGVSSPQLDVAERGFSFNKEAPLDMRMNQSDRLTADDVVNRYPTKQLAKVIHEYGEEGAKTALIMAKNIVAHRPIKTTTDLADLIEQQFGRRGRVHPATKLFQAIRIEVNQELVQIEQVLPLLPKLLKSGGRLAIITFHSLEDRLVKQFLQREYRKGLVGELVATGKPISGKIEKDSNPRSRSAMLRGAYKK
ncbi:MAG: 16S rRNA (cytosine(1402)-N(4))-methyltransferase RsmH [Candidatus Nanosyncoccaceae bacterium]|jgi:16S rRNA (cytosine1402-N4)-methyltransferase